MLETMAGRSSRTPDDPYVSLAARAVGAYIMDGRVLDPPPDCPEGMRRRAGVFVSIKKHGGLRGCIGTFSPTEATVADELTANAIKSATADPRFPPVTAAELPDLEITVDVLSEPEPCRPTDLDPARYGVLVESGRRRGLLLPDLPGVTSVEEQIEIAKRKAGIEAQEPCTLSRFTVERHA